MWAVSPQDDGTYTIANEESGENFTWVKGGDNSHIPPELYRELIQVMVNYYESGEVEPSVGQEGIKDLPSGKRAFDVQFESHSPSGFGQSGGFGTQGAAWHSRSPSGWNSPGGWSLNSGPSDMWKRMQGGLSRRDAAGMTAARRFPGIQVSERIHDLMARRGDEDLGVHTSRYERALEDMKRRQGMLGGD